MNGTDRRRARGRRLTDRQAEILDLVAQGLENKEIGQRLGISEQAVKDHVSTLLDRLEARNRAALAELATELKIVGSAQLDPGWLSYVYQESPLMSAILRGPDHVFVAANAAYRRAAGGRELIGHPFMEVFPDREPVVGLLDRVRASGQPLVLHELPGRWDRGAGVEEEGYTDVALQPLPGTDGVVAGVAVFVVDVTDEVRARQSLAELSTEQLALLDLVPSAIVVLDERGSVVKVNRAAQELLGAGPYAPVSPESAARYRIRDGVTGRAIPFDELHVAEALAGRPVRGLEVNIYLPALGRDAHLRIDGRPLRTPDGVVHGVVAVLTEVAPTRSPSG